MTEATTNPMANYDWAAFAESVAALEAPTESVNPIENYDWAAFEKTVSELTTTNLENLEAADVSAGSTNDNIIGTQGDDVIRAGDGDDYIQPTDGNDQVFGGNGDDIIYGGDGDDILDGGRGDDTLLGGDGDDVFLNSQSANVFSTGGQRDVAYGEGGDDLFQSSGVGTEFFDGGEGIDRVELAGDRGNTSISFGEDGSFSTSIGGPSFSSRASFENVEFYRYGDSGDWIEVGEFPGASTGAGATLQADGSLSLSSDFSGDSPVQEFDVFITDTADFTHTDDMF